MSRLLHTLLAATVVCAVPAWTHSAAARGHGGFHGGGGGKGRGRSVPPVYVIVDAVEIRDVESFKTAVAKVVTALPSLGGHLLVDSSSPSSLKGDVPQRFLVIAFGNMTDINSWKDSPAYKALDVERGKAAKIQVFSVDGLPDAPIALGRNGKEQPAPFYPLGDRDRKSNRAISNSIMDICKGC